jgi:hypothetical protein
MKYNVNPGIIGISALMKEIDGTSFARGVSVEPWSQVSLIVDIQPEDTLMFIDLLNKHGLLYSTVKENS